MGPSRMHPDSPAPSPSSRHTVVAPPNPLRSLAADAAAIHEVVASIAGPVVLVGHSYGGAVITQASATLSNVSALVYLAGFGIDEGESCASVQGPFPPSMLATNSVATSYHAPGAPDRPDLYVAHDTFRFGDARHAASALSGRPDRECDRGPDGRPSHRGISPRTKTTRSRLKPRCSWPSGWAQRPSTSTALTQHSSRSHRSPPHSLRRRRRLTTANDRKDHLARRRGLTAPRHPLPVCGVVQGSLARTAGVAWTTKATVIRVGLVAVTVGISPSPPRKRLRGTVVGVTSDRTSFGRTEGSGEFLGISRTGDQRGRRRIARPGCRCSAS